nr:hypothetical protein [Tanacetum cinerariifolium]
MNSSTIVSRIHHTSTNRMTRLVQLLMEVLKQQLKGIDNDIYSTVDACPYACEMWKAIERKFTSWDGESLESYFSRFYKMMNELVRNQCDVTNHQVNVQFLLQLQLEWQRSQQAATRNRSKAIVNSPPPIYDQEPTMVAEDDEISKDKEIDKLMDNSLWISRGIGYDNQRIVNVAGARETVEPSMVDDDDDDDETSKDKEIDKLMALISLSFKKIYKPTNNNLRTSSNTNHVNQDNSLRINRNTGYESQRSGNVVGARETKPKRAKDAAYHREKMLLCKQEEAGIQLNAEQADWKDDIDDESDDQELEAHYMYMAKIQEVSPDAVKFGPIFDTKPEQKVQNDDHYNVFAIECQHPEQSESVH